MALWLSRAARRIRPLSSASSIISRSPLQSHPQFPNRFDAPVTSPRTLETHIPPSKFPWTGLPPWHRAALGGPNCILSLASISTSPGTAEGGGSLPPAGGGEGSPPKALPSWIDLYLPVAVQPYALLARLDKPIGTWLLAWPCAWSITMAAPQGEFPDLKMLALFGCGSVLLRGAGCTVNDLLDRDIDRKILGASSLLLVFSYPLMKRLTFWPQAFLGLTFNWGVLLGWAAVKGSLDPAIVIPLYSAGFFWTLVYDTIYAHQDKEDDLKVGVKSTALRFGSSTKNWITGFGVACVGSLSLSGYNAELAWLYYPFLMTASGQLWWQIQTVDLSNRADCNKKFVSNKWFGALVFSGILFGRLAS